MANPERRTTNTGIVRRIASLDQLGARGGELIAVINVRQKLRGDDKRRTTEIWYPLITPTELATQTGDKVRVRWKTEPVGKGSHTSATLEKV